MQYKIPSDVDLSKFPWGQLFQELVNEFESAHLHSFLDHSLQQIGEIYQMQNRSLKFLTDLFMLGVNKLFSCEYIMEWHRGQAAKANKKWVGF